jgi:hypothetical protein
MLFWNKPPPGLRTGDLQLVFNETTLTDFFTMLASCLLLDPSGRMRGSSSITEKTDVSPVCAKAGIDTG